MALNCPKSIINTINHVCPICGKTNSTELNKSSVFEFTINVCNECGFIYRERWMDKESFLKYGKRFHRSYPNQGYFQKELIQEYTINKLIDFDGNERVLFVNSGIGHAANSLKAKSVIGLELSDTHYEFSKRMYPNVDSRNSISCKDSQFDVVIIWDYIQFMIQPCEYLKAIREKMTDNAMLILSCPIIEKPSQDYLSSGLADQYSAFFTNDTLHLLVNASGFKVESQIDVLKNPILICKKSDESLLVINSEHSKFEMNRYIKIASLIEKGDLDSIKKINPKVHSCYFKFKFDSPEAIDHEKIHAELVDANEHLPNYIPITGLIAQYYYTTKQYEKAIELFKFITDVSCDSSVAELYAVCLYDMGIFDESLYWLQIANKMAAPNAGLIDKMSSAIIAMRELKNI
jgi:hypothetical protein